MGNHANAETSLNGSETNGYNATLSLTLANYCGMN